MHFKNPKIYQSYQKIQELREVDATYLCDEGVRISFESDEKEANKIYHLAQELKPWRKGPFFLNDLFIDSEWRSFIKWNQIAPHIDLRDKEVADIGCNNGYYLFEMLKSKPKSLVGFDPSELFFAQFSFINHFLKTTIVYEMLGVDDLKDYQKKFDVIFCLGVLYHRSDPIRSLKSLSQGLKTDGELILDTLIIDHQDEVALTPKVSYARMKNVYFIPSIPALQAWCFRANLELVEVLSIKETTTQEQRQTPWIDSLSLDSFLNLSQDQTIEGYPPPKRGYFKFKRSR
ncbi:MULTISPECIES: tRNA 5-methoxyuridine(34)/uridine 5-oxyacetic acid(34) synthase CmoB [unclassified Helicobacter]|uniref:tRNA 5-methoxyuridine(34)/uridine 5-oxyacetic acid(34) synthase CmoB n=1 Tax=unclassified Helicobacter TaxID=2593540 RepID=UPI000CF18451|nr:MULTISPECIES: tRNA 5-methoxyuridine(34)/uridine 5-oxyacetic acid(34) synthase CmoB [unclassified Helicobacter]